jgi:ABC-type bacteriocin/lantibiotic exporter with double-glycine peptidase domain
MGLHTILTNEGHNFSQGQKQRILIARALISKPRVLLLDEATNALDSHTQSIIHQNLDRMNVTRLVIAHNLSTIRYADRIYVIDKGKIADSGTFTELTRRPGIFSDLVKKQKLSV